MSATATSMVRGGKIAAIVRRFTKDKTDPYYGIKWVKRSAKISEPNGTVIFQMDEIEAPEFWSQLAVDIVASKYFRKAGVPNGAGTGAETSVRQLIDRVAGSIANQAVVQGYFDDEGAKILKDELTYLLVHQYAAFNSPVWFNAGLVENYNVRGSAAGLWAVDKSGVAREMPDAYTRPALSACFIQTVDDNLMGIADGVKREMRVFKMGGGSGANYSNLRANGEGLSGGGKSSGLMSFLEIFDAAAGAIKSGGTVRRAARMVVLNADHPDIETFVEWKVREEKKVAAMIAAGYSSDFNGEAYRTVGGQNANNSVRVTDAFMNAVKTDADWSTIYRTNKKIAKTFKARSLMRKIAEAAHACADPGMQFDTTCNAWHTTPEAGRQNSTNPCSEYSYVDNSACNLASLNLQKFMDDRGFDVEGFCHAVDVFITAMDLVVDYASYPTKEIAENSHNLRPLGLGYANLGALLMRLGLPYDSAQGRALCGMVTSLMTARAYRRSSQLAAGVGPFNGFAFNRQPMLGVIRRHFDAMDKIPPFAPAGSGALTEIYSSLNTASIENWQDAYSFGGVHGYRNGQATLLAPTGCLVPGSLVLTEHGLTRIEDLGDPAGKQWQDASFKVQTDQGPREATKFYVNGEADVIEVTTERGFKITGTGKHQVKVVDANGVWRWSRFAEIEAGETTPLLLGGVFGEGLTVALPQCPPSYRTNHGRGVKTPEFMSTDLAFLVGLFMAEGSLHTKGLRFSLTKADHDLIERTADVSRALFNVDPTIEDHGECVSVNLSSTQVRAWWQTAGFSKTPRLGGGKGATCAVPDAVLATNNTQVYGAFLNGLFSGDGSVSSGLPSLTNKDSVFVSDVQTMLLVLGLPFRRDVQTGGISGKPVYRLTAAGRQFGRAFMERVGFSAERKGMVVALQIGAFCRGDYIPMPQKLVDEVCPVRHEKREEAIRNMREANGLHRPLAEALAAQTGNLDLKHRLGFFYDQIKEVELAGRSQTYDISVPENVTYVANGFVSHNTIGLLMDCFTGDTLVAVADGRNAVALSQLTDEGNDVDVYASDGGRTVIKTMRNIRLVREKTRVVRVLLDDGSTVRCTPEHQFMLRDGTFKRADKLTAGTSLMRFDSRVTDKTGLPRREVWMGPSFGGNRNMGNSWHLQYRLIGQRAFPGYDGRSGGLVHHSSHDTLDDSVQNLKLCSGTGEHLREHWAAMSPDERSAILKARLSTLTTEQLKERSRKSHAAQTPDQRKARARKAVEAHTSEDRSEWTTKGWSKIGSATRAERARKAWATRRAAQTPSNHKVVSVIPDGVEDVYCGEVDDLHNFAIVTSHDDIVGGPLSGVVVHNCDTTGIEPDYSLVKYKKLAGGGSFKIVNQSVGPALGHLGYRLGEVSDILKYIEQKDTIEGAPYLKPEHLAVFDCAAKNGETGQRALAPMSHLHMMAAAQPFLSGAISKTVNCPEETTVEEIEQIYITAWELGLKAVAIYRENSKLCAILSGKADKPKDSTPVKAPVDEEAVQPAPTRRRLPKRRKGLTQEATIGGHKLYLRTGEYADGKLGEIFIDMHKQGATMSAMLDSFAKLLSISIQYGVPLEVLVEKFIHTKFEPKGIVHGDESIRLATSLLDYVFRALGIEYLGRTDLSNRTPEAAEKHVAPPTNGAHLTHVNGAKPKSFSNKSGETCGVCGDITVRSGTCSVCLNCGNNTGC